MERDTDEVEDRGGEPHRHLQVSLFSCCMRTVSYTVHSHSYFQTTDRCFRILMPTTITYLTHVPTQTHTQTQTQYSTISSTYTHSIITTASNCTQMHTNAHNAHTRTTRLSHTQTNSSTTCRCHTATVIVTASSNIRQHTNYYHVNLFHSLPFTEPGATPDTASPSSTTPDDDDLYIYYIDKSGKRRRRPRPRATPSDTPTSSTPVTGSVKRESHT